MSLSLVGVLLYTGKKGSWFWPLGFLPNTTLVLGMHWQSSPYIPLLFGIGGTVIMLSFFGILWLWTRTYAACEGVARTGKQIQLLGYSILVATGILLCMHFGDPNQIALAQFPVPGALTIDLTLALAMQLLFTGHYMVAKSSTGTTGSP